MVLRVILQEMVDKPSASTNPNLDKSFR